MDVGERQFLRAAELLSGSKGQVALPDAQLLRLYALYKQGTAGPNAAARPGLLDPRGRAKWDAWTALGGMPRETAWRDYHALVVAALPAAQKAQLLAAG